MVIWKYKVEAGGDAIEINMPGYQLLRKKSPVSVCRCGG